MILHIMKSSTTNLKDFSWIRWTDWTGCDRIHIRFQVLYYNPCLLRKSNITLLPAAVLALWSCRGLFCNWDGKLVGLPCYCRCLVPSSQDSFVSPDIYCGSKVRIQYDASSVMSLALDGWPQATRFDLRATYIWILLPRMGDQLSKLNGITE